MTSTNPPNSPTLADALAHIEISLAEDQIARLEQYCRLLWEWNDQLNLTRHTDFDAVASRDIVDSLQLSELLHEGENVLDIGSGGGAPGVILAVLRPDLQISLCESVGKKATALQDIVERMQLAAPVHNQRAENLLKDNLYDVLTARAVGPMWKICTWLEPHWGRFGRLLAVKGPKWVAERGEARHRGLMNDLALRCAARYQPPGVEWESVILKIWPKDLPEP